MADERRDRRIAEIDRDGSPQIDMIVLIDRDVDMVTPLCTQTTYEGLLDEVLGISATGTVAFQSAAETEAGPGPGPGPGPDADANASRNEREKTKTIRARLDSGDALFAELRDLNFGRACETLRAKSFAMQSEYRSMESDARAMSVSAIGGFVRKMRAAVSPGAGLELHTALAERALDSTRGDAHFRRVRFAEVLDTERLCLGHAALFREAALQGLQEGLQDALRIGADTGVATVCERVEAMAFRGENVRRAARLLALACLTHGGIPRSRYDALRREMVHAYGPPCVLLLQRMEEAGIAFAREDEKVSETERSAKETKALRDAPNGGGGGGRRTPPCAAPCVCWWTTWTMRIQMISRTRTRTAGTRRSPCGSSWPPSNAAGAQFRRRRCGTSPGRTSSTRRAAILSKSARTEARPSWSRYSGTRSTRRYEARSARRFRRLKRTAARTAARWFWRFSSAA